MSTTPSAATMLPPAIRIAKIIGILGAGALAGTYITHSSHTLPAIEDSKHSTSPAVTGQSNISHQQPAAQAVKIFHKIHRRSHGLLRNLIIASAGSYSYVAYYLYNYPISAIHETTTTFTSSSFLPHNTVQTVGGVEFFGMAGEWMFSALPAALILAIIPFSKFGMKTVNHRLNAAGESLRVEEEKNSGLQIVNEQSTWSDLETWRKRNWYRAGLAGLAGLIGGAGMVIIHS